MVSMNTITNHAVSIGAGVVDVEGDLTIPAGATGVVLFAHGSGSSRHSPRNAFVARALNEASLATLLMDLLTPAEEMAERFTGHLRFDIGLLAARLAAAIDFLARDAGTRKLPVGLFGASTGGGAALVAATQLPRQVAAVVSRGGRPDLGSDAFPGVAAPTLLVVGGEDSQVITFNRQAYARLRCEKRLEIVPGASHLFEEPGTLETVAQLAAEWFRQHLAACPAASTQGR